MAKSLSVWRTESGTGELGNENEGLVLLLETGDSLLLETGDDLLLEDSSYEPKALTSWDSETKTATGWHDQGFGEFSVTGSTVERLTEDGTTRLMQDGTVRVLEDGDFTPKATTAWTESDS